VNCPSGAPKEHCLPHAAGLYPSKEKERRFEPRGMFWEYQIGREETPNQRRTYLRFKRNFLAREAVKNLGGGAVEASQEVIESSGGAGPVDPKLSTSLKTYSRSHLMTEFM